MKYFTSVTLLTSFGPPPAIRTGSWRIGLEAGIIPRLGRRERTVGFGGTKVEDLNKLPVIVRPRLTFGLPGHFSLTASGIPPITINGVQPRILALALARPMVSVGGFSAGLTLSGQLGEVEGDFTCTEEQAAAGDNLEENPFACETRSRDVIGMNYVSLELTAGYRIEVLHGLTPYVSIAANYLNNTFQVNARYAGSLDRTALQTTGFTGSGTAGLTFGLAPFLNLSAQMFVTPLTVTRAFGARDVDALINARLLLEAKVL